MDENADLISCLMVTHPSLQRFALFQRSVACFLAQTYPHRELVVVLDEGSPEDVQRVKDHLAPLGEIVRVEQPASKCTLGALRNRSAAATNGSVLCGWDDDDLSHPTRLAEQYGLLQRENAVAVGLQDVFHLFLQSRQMYWANYHIAPDGCPAGTVMFRRNACVRWPEAGPTACKTEDSALLDSLKSTGKVVHVAGMPYLYVYVYHGANTFDKEHHLRAVGLLGISKGLLLRRRALFDNLACVPLGEEAINVMGNNGLAFTLQR